MNIIEELASVSGGLPLGKLCERLNLPRTSVLSLLRALEDAKFVVVAHGIYRLGEAALRLGSLISTAYPFPISIRGILAELAAQNDETGLLSVLSQGGLESVYVDKADSARAIRYYSAIGVRRPLHTSAAGKVLLAFRGDDFVRAYIEGSGLAAMTSRTITDPKHLRAELSRIREAGLALSLEEYSEGVGAYAAPVFDGFGLVVASVSLAGPADRIRAGARTFPQAVVSAGLAMSSILGSREVKPSRSISR
jgi:DNA-binding IclR family transcriptional regulator